MFGVNDERLIEGLEAIRKRLCVYPGPTCDCKFGASGKGEQTGCPEVRQAIEYLKGQHEQVIVWERSREDSAKHALERIRGVLRWHDGAVADATTQTGDSAPHASDLTNS